jgi:hypothetical protein
MIRALAHDLGREDQVQGVRVPRHEPGPPETLTDTDYANLLRVADRRTLAGKRDYALYGAPRTMWRVVVNRRLPGEIALV